MDSENSHSNSTQCSACLIGLNDNSHYKCKTCTTEDSPSILCKLCIISHSRRDHIVSDSCGHALDICEKHKNLRLNFCVTCDVTFCADCLDNHPKHEFQTVESKASHVRRKVFDYIGKFDEQYKELRHRKQLWADILEARQKSDDYYTAEKLYDLIFEGVKVHVIEKLEKLIETDREKKKSVFEDNIDQVVEGADQLNVEMREFLALSDGRQIRDLSLLTPKLDESLKNQNEKNSKVRVFEELQFTRALDNSTFNETIDGILNELSLHELKTPVLEISRPFEFPTTLNFLRPKQPTLFGCSSEIFCYISASVDDNVLIKTHFTQNSWFLRVPIESALSTVKFSEIVDVSCSGHFLWLKLSTDTSVFYNCKLKEEVTEDGGTVKNVVAIKSVSVDGEAKLRFITWDSEQNCIRLHDHEMIKCEICPKIAQFSNCGRYFLFADSEDNVCMVELEGKKKRTTITRAEHGLGTVHDLFHGISANDSRFLLFNHIKMKMCWVSTSGVVKILQLRGTAEYPNVFNLTVFNHQVRGFSGFNSEHHNCSDVLCCGRGGAEKNSRMRRGCCIVFRPCEVYAFRNYVFLDKYCRHV